MKLTDEARENEETMFLFDLNLDHLRAIFLLFVVITIACPQEDLTGIGLYKSFQTYKAKLPNGNTRGNTLVMPTIVGLLSF